MFAQVAKILWDVVSPTAISRAAFSRFIRSPIRFSRANLPLPHIISSLRHRPPPFRPVAPARTAVRTAVRPAALPSRCGYAFGSGSGASQVRFSCGVRRYCKFVRGFVVSRFDFLFAALIRWKF